MKSIKRKLTVNFIFIIVVTVVLFELLIINIVKQNYYKNLEDSLSNQVKVACDIYYKYFSDSTLRDNVLNNVDTFWKQSTAQVQIIDTSGKVLMDSIGTIPSDNAVTEDVKAALKGERGRWIGKVAYDNGKVMSVAYPLKSRDNIVGVLRYVTSLREVNKDINKLTIIFIYIGAIVILISGIISVFLADSIVDPLKDITRTAEKMAGGNFNIQSVKRNDDEIGKLSDTLNYMAQEILKKDQLKNEFISSVSHELRTPLTSIKGWAVTLREGASEDKDILQDGLEIVENECDRLTAMVEELLDFSKFVSGRITMENEEISIEEVVYRVGKQMEPRARRENIEFEIISCQGLPIINTDGNRLKQVFINILDNSFKFTPPGGKVTFTADFGNNKIHFLIKDTGCGISSEDLPKVKEKFFKGRNSKSQNGIGLSICDEIIKLMEGTFEIESEVGKGTEISITLPIC